MTPRVKKIKFNYSKEGHYTDESPGGPWSKAMRAMIERDKRLEKLEKEQLPKLFKERTS